MTPEQMDTIAALNELLVEGNNIMIQLLRQLPPEDQKKYLPTVQEIIQQTIQTVKN